MDNPSPLPERGLALAPRAGLVRPVEAVEKMRQIFGGDARAVIVTRSQDCPSPPVSTRTRGPRRLRT